MPWTTLYADLLRRFAAKFPLPIYAGGGDPPESYLDELRAWMKRLGEQFAFTFGAGWGRKRADPNRPWSKDCLPHKNGGGFVGWDIMDGAGTGHPTLSAENPSQYDLTGQYFEPLQPINWLEEVEPPPPPPPPPPPSDLEARVGQLESRLSQTEVQIARLESIFAAMKAAM